MGTPVKGQSTAPSIPSSGPRGTKELSEMAASTFAVAPAPPPDPLTNMLAPPLKNPAPEFSIITCSVNDSRFEQMAGVYKQVMQGENYEIIRISDATGLAEGYQRGIDRARGHTLIFSHDDAAPVRPFAARLRNHLRRADVVAGAGSDRLDGPAWFTAGPANVFGQVLNNVPAPAGHPPFLLSIYSVPARLVGGIQAFDGFWFACNRGVFDTLTFDAEMCDGFHMYDVDFSYRAFKAGLKVAVATDLCLMHASVGGYADPKWRPAADKWLARYGGELAPHRNTRFQLAGISGYEVHELIGLMEDMAQRAEE